MLVTQLRKILVIDPCADRELMRQVVSGTSGSGLFHTG